MKEERETHTHESYGMISFSRVQGRANFFATELTSNSYIQCTIKTGEVDRKLGKEWFYGKQHVTQLRLSANQFSELITNMNCGDGVPCTLEFYNGKQAAPLPKIENMKQYTHRKFEDRMVEFAKTLKERQDRVKELAAKKTLTKSDQEELNSAMEWITREIALNIPFFSKSFQEIMDTVVLEAKQDIDASVQHKIATIGLEELHKQQNLLLDKNKEEQHNG